MTQQAAPPETRWRTRSSLPPEKVPTRRPRDDSTTSSAFAGPRTRLDRLGRVEPGTVVAWFARDADLELKQPGDLLVPSWMPFRGGVDVMIINTEIVTLSVTVDGLLTLDGEDLDRVRVDVDLRLRPSALAELVADHGGALGERLQTDARRTIESSVRAAVGMNRAEDLRRTTLAPVLEDRWLPKSLLHGALTREGFTVREVRWRDAPDDPDTAVPSREKSAVRVEARDENPSPAPGDGSDPRALHLGGLASRRRHASGVSAAEALSLVHVPAIISVGAGCLFFVVFWVPEFASFPGAQFVLEQFAPLVSKELTSQSEAVVPSQVGHLGLPAAFMLLVSLLLAPLARSRWWLARLALWPLTYLSVISAVVTVLGVLVRGSLGANFLGTALLAVWAVVAVRLTWRSVGVDVETLPARPAKVLWLLGLFALVNPLPVALGRRVFAPELRTAAASVTQNDLTLRWAALLTPTTALVYLSGVLLGVLFWCVYLLGPPRQTTRVVTVAALAVGAVVALLFLGPAAHRSGEHRAEEIRTQSPSQEVSFTCGSWAQQRPGLPAQTLVVSGLSCKRLTSFTGYHEVVTRETEVSLSPVRIDGMNGERISGKLVGAQYDGLVVLAATDRLDNRATEVVGLRLTDAITVWRFACVNEDLARLRFAGASDGDDSTAGRVTLPGESPAVVMACGPGTIRLDPRTGKRT
ncbi:MAG: hypothetical protein ABWY56_13100 [Propionibacteriaceae bacterium]